MERGRTLEHATPTCLRPSEPESWRAIARVASRTNQWAAALEWWKKVDEAHRLTAEDRRDFIAAAVVAGEIPVAARQVEALLAQRCRAGAYRYRVGGSSRCCARAILFSHSIMPNVRSPTSAQNRMTFSRPPRSFSRTPDPIRSHTPARGTELKMQRAIRRTPGRCRRSFFSHGKRRCHP